MKKGLLILVIIFSLLPVGCDNGEVMSADNIPTSQGGSQIVSESPTEISTNATSETLADSQSEQLLKIEVNENTFYADFEENSSADALKEKLTEGAITIEMHDYGNFEKVGDLPFALPRNDTRITTEAGDVILYQGNQLTIYYDTNSWSFTRVAKIRNADSSLGTLLGDGTVTVTLSMENRM